MTPAQDFQARHGANWAAIVNEPILNDALLTVNSGLLTEIAQMSPAEIASPSGNVVLAILKGQLMHERALIELSILQPDATSDLPAETYGEPQDDFQDNGDVPQVESVSFSGPFADFQQHPEPEPIAAKPKHKRKRKK